jgi:hypothetical protein
MCMRTLRPVAPRSDETTSFHRVARRLVVPPALRCAGAHVHAHTSPRRASIRRNYELPSCREKTRSSAGSSLRRGSCACAHFAPSRLDPTKLRASIVSGRAFVGALGGGGLVCFAHVAVCAGQVELGVPSCCGWRAGWGRARVLCTRRGFVPVGWDSGFHRVAGGRAGWGRARVLCTRRGLCRPGGTRGSIVLRVARWVGAGSCALHTSRFCAGRVGLGVSLGCERRWWGGIGSLR